MLYFIIFLIGIVAGNVTGIIGASGVAVVVPAFVLLGYAPSKAIGASLFIDTVASLIVSWTYYQNKNLVIKKAIWIAVGSMIGAQIGSLLSPFIPDMGLNSAFSAFLFMSAAIFWLRGKYGMLPTENEGRRYFKIIKYLQKNEKLFGILLGFLTGIMSGILGTGGGVMILLILVIIMGFTMHEGIGTSTLIMAFTAGSGAIGHALSSDLPIDVAIIGSIGTIAGGRIAAKFANKIDDRILSKVAAGLFIVLGISMLIITRKFQNVG